mgnify:CR=1 FL=1
MNLKELNQIYYIDREIEKDERELKELRASVISLTQEISDMPRATNVKDKTAEYISRILDLEKMIELNLERKQIEKKRIMAFIESIDDSRIRLIFHYRFIKNLHWVEVARLISPHETDVSVRVACHRYLKTCNACNTCM